MNRKPERSEVEACSPNLWAILQALPRVRIVVTAGKTDTWSGLAKRYGATTGQLERINQAAYGVPSALEVATARKARANAYAGTLNPFADFDAVTVPTYLPKRGTDHPLETAARELPPVATPDAVRRLKAAGDTRTDLYAQLIAEHGAEVPAAWLEAQLAALAGGSDGRRASNGF